MREIVIMHGAESLFLNGEVVGSFMNGVDREAAVGSRNGLQSGYGTVEAYDGAAVIWEWIAGDVVQNDFSFDISLGDVGNSDRTLWTLGSLRAYDVFFVTGEKEQKNK